MSDVERHYDLRTVSASWEAFDEPSFAEVEALYGSRPGIYKVVLLKEDRSAPLPIRRLVSDDESGVIYIGKQTRSSKGSFSFEERCGPPTSSEVLLVLDYVPGSFRVIRHVRPKLSCRAYETIAQAPAPSLPVRRGRAGAGLLAHVLVAKYADHLPLHRQAEIYAREDVELCRSTLADMVGQTARLVRPLVDALARHVMSAERLHADDTVVPVLEPGRGRTRQARLWTYVRDDRPFGGADPPAVLYRYSPDRKGEHPRAHLAMFQGILQADGYSGFKALYADGRVTEASCWAHARRGFFEAYEKTHSPLAREALDHIGALYRIEEFVRGRTPGERLLLRAERTAPLMDELSTCSTPHSPASRGAANSPRPSAMLSPAGMPDQCAARRSCLHRQLGR